MIYTGLQDCRVGVHLNYYNTCLQLSGTDQTIGAFLYFRKKHFLLQYKTKVKGLLSTWRPHRKSADILAHFLPTSETSALFLFCGSTDHDRHPIANPTAFILEYSLCMHVRFNLRTIPEYLNFDM